MATKRKKASGKRGKAGGRWRQAPEPSTTANYVFEFGNLIDRIDAIVMDHISERNIELEAALDFYAYGPEGRLEEPMRGEEYIKAIAADGGKIARAYLKDRFDAVYYGRPNKKKPGGWGCCN